MFMAFLESLAGTNLLAAVFICLILLFAQQMDKKYLATGRYVLWLLTMVFLLLPFTPFTSLRQATLHINLEFLMHGEDAPGVGSGIIVLSETSKVPDYPAAMPHDEARTPSLLASSPHAAILLIWLVGAVVSALWYLGGHLRLARFLKRWQIADADSHNSDVLAELLAEEAARLGICKPIQIKIAKGIKSPMLFGLFKPVIWLGSADYSINDLKFILRHEMVHYKRRDLWYKFALVVFRCLYWNNPFVHMMAMQANKDIEAICDHLTVEDMGKKLRKRYSSLILSMASDSAVRVSPVSTQMSGEMNALKKRFANIIDGHKFGSKKKGWGVFAFLGMVLIITGLLFGVRFGGSPVFADEAATEAEAMVTVTEFVTVVTAVAAAEPRESGESGDAVMSCRDSGNCICRNCGDSCRHRLGSLPVREESFFEPGLGVSLPSGLETGLMSNLAVVPGNNLSINVSVASFGIEAGISAGIFNILY